MVDYYKSAGAMKSSEDLAALAPRLKLTHAEEKLVFVMVGLPARGKSFISKKLHAFHNWLGLKCRIFNAGQSRREEADTAHCSWTVEGARPGTAGSCGRADFFDTHNKEAAQRREEIAMATLDDLLRWLVGEGDMAIFDATNSNPARRRAVLDRVAAADSEGPIQVVFVESICDDERMLEANLRLKARSSPDFEGMDEKAALADLRARLAHYESAYQSVTDEEGSYIKIYNLSSKVTAKDVYGRIASSVLPYMIAIHIARRSVFLVALPPEASPGASPGGSCLFSKRIATWAASLQQVAKKKGKLHILASTKPHSIEAAGLVASALGVHPRHLSGLNPLDRGCSLLSADDDNTDMAFNQRYDGGGESLADLVGRLEPCLLDVEAAVDPVLVIAHVFPCRVLRAYFLGCEVAKAMHEPRSKGACALANGEQLVVELQPQLGGGYSECIHDLRAGHDV